MGRQVIGYGLIVLSIVIFGMGSIIGLLTHCKPACADDGGQTWMTGLVPAAPFFALGVVALWAGTKTKIETSDTGGVGSNSRERKDS